MTDTTTRDILTRLESQEARLTAQATELARYRAARVARPPRSRNPLRRLLVPITLLALLALAPLGALAANFVDLNPGSGHNANINAIADAGITKGCFDTSHYCPNDFVTREQMASFLARTAGLNGNAPVTNAKTAQTATLAETANTVPDGAITPAHAPTITVRSTSGTVNVFTTVTVVVNCNAGEQVTGGGYTMQQNGLAAGISAPLAAPNQGWTVDVMNSSSNQRNYTIYALCLAP